MIKGKQWKLIRKNLNKAGQVASLILLSIAVLFFLGSAGIFFAQKKMLQTKAMIAADAGGMYLNSQIGSYAHYLSCKYIGCRCHKSKKRWGMILAIPLMVVGTIITGSPLVGITSGLSLAVSDEIQVEQGVKDLNKQFKELSSTNIKEAYKWITIQYISQMLADPGALSGLLEDIKNKSESENAGKSSDGLYNLADAIADELLDAYDDTLGSLTTTVSVSYGDKTIYTEVSSIPSILSAIDEWDSLVGGRVVDPSFYTESNSDPDFTYNYTISSTDYVRYVLFQNPYPDGSGDDLSLSGLMFDLRRDYIDGIDALLSIRDFEVCDPNEEDCSDEDTYSVELNKAKDALQAMKDNINRYDLDSYGPLRVVSYCWADDFDCIQYDGDPYSTLQYISSSSSHSSYYLDSPKMSRGDYQNLKDDLMSQIDNAIQAIDSFLARVDSIFNKYKDELDYWFGPVDYDYKYTWTDSLGRHHRLNVGVTFRLPRIKVKKKLFKVKIKLKRCYQSMHVMACRNDFCYHSTVHYNAHGGDGPTTSHWWIDGY